MRNRESYTNYKEISTNVEDAEPVADLASEEIVESESEGEIEKPVEVIKEEDTDVILRGRVENCSSLNVRERPDVSSNVLYIYPEGCWVIIVENESTDDFYKITDPQIRLEGYVMKKYITIV